MYGSFLTSKNFSLLSLPPFMPLPVFTLAASILTSKTPVVGSVDLNVKVAFHFSNVLSRATEVLTLKLITLSPGMISNTGTPAGVCA